MATMYEEKTTSPVNISLEMPRLRKVSWYSSISPVMTHSRPPIALSIPSMISMKKKITDQNCEPGSVATACGYTSNTSPGPCSQSEVSTAGSWPITAHLVRHVLDVLVLGVRHVAEVGEDDEAREEAGGGVDCGGDETVAVAVVVELVVAGVGEVDPEAGPHTANTQH